MEPLTPPARNISASPGDQRARPLVRSVHRVASIVTVLVMLWLSITGMSMQIIDLHSILTHEATTTPTGLSIAEGMYGPGDFAVIQVSDFTAPALPAGFDIKQCIHTVLQAAHVSQAVGGQFRPMAWVELRILNGQPVGQIMLGTELIAFNAQTGAAVTPVPPVPLPQGRGLPPSLRQKLKTNHRFWNRQDTPGVYFEFIVGLVLLFLILSGLAIYFQMLGVRFKQHRWEPLWVSGGWWRSTHRVISIVSAVFLLCISLSGTWIGFESSAGPLRRALMGTPAAVQPGASPQAGQRPARRRNPVDFILPLRDQEVEEMTDTTLESMQRLHPSTPIKAIRLRTYGQTKQGVVVTGGSDTDQFVFNADTGEPASLTEQGYPASNFPFGVQVHENVKHFHSGAMFGGTGRVFNLFAGFSLAFLSISGLVMYFDMWLKRRKSGRGSFVWR